MSGTETTNDDVPKDATQAWPEQDYVILFKDGNRETVRIDMLEEWVTDITSWLNFARCVVHPGYAAEMAVWLPGRDRPAETIRLVPENRYVQGATFADPFNSRAAPASSEGTARPS